jgi:hypothetical protein
MKITHRQSSTKLAFGELKAGDCFVDLGDIIMKIDEILAHVIGDKYATYNAFNLSEYKHIFREKDLIVCLVKAELIVES